MTLTLAADAAPARDAPEPWQVLVVDDDPEVRAVTHLSLQEFRFEGRSARIHDAGSLEAAKRQLAEIPDIALILLDVVMETEHAGLDLVRYVRDQLDNHAIRIVLRTGQPGQAPALQVAERYEIDDYRLKTELTFERLQVLVTTALRSYGRARQLEARSQALAEHVSELERFNYVASHDMQTPLANIARLVQLLQVRLAGNLNERQRELMDLLVSSTRDLQRLIDDLLALARVGRGQCSLTDLVDLDRTMGRVAKQLRSLLDERAVRLEYSSLPVVVGNEVLLEQLLRNLIGNAIKFQPGEHPYVGVKVTETDRGWELRVVDSGIGIEAEYLERIFEPFHRLHTHEQFPGSGVGLAICRRVARLHGGDIRAESVPGQGTTMIVTLPTRPAGGAPKPA